MPQAHDTEGETDDLATDARPVIGPGAPPTLRDIGQRERLLDLVRRGVDGQLTLVSAPAGSGKTALLADWVALSEAPGPVVWVTMERGEDRPEGFWWTALRGLERAGVDVSDNLAPTPAGEMRRSKLLELAACIAAHGDPVVLVLDDAEYLVDRAFADELDFLLGHSGGNLHVVLMTRVDPALPLYHYRLHGEITEIRAEDLAFDVAEAAALMQREGLTLTGDQLHAVIDRAGGWAAGLKFLAMSLAGRTNIDEAIGEFTGGDGDVAEYLVAEVLDAQPTEMRDVLLRTSVVQEMYPGLVEAMTGQPHGQRLLESMAHAHSFMHPVPGAPIRYRYQSLFREFLRAQFAYEQPDMVGEMHRRAADWLAKNGLFTEAVHHAVKAGDWDEAAGYLVEALAIGRLLPGPGSDHLSRIFAQSDGAESPAAWIVRAALAINVQDARGCAAALDEARAHLDADDPRTADGCRLSISVLEALGAHLASDPEAGLAAVAAAEVQLSHAAALPDAGRRELEAIVAGCKGRLMLWKGDFTAARAALDEAIRAAEASGVEELLLESLGSLALVEALTGHLRRAVELAGRADVVSARSGVDLLDRSAAAATALAWVRAEEYDLTEARHLARRARAVPVRQDTSARPVLALVDARLLRAQGDIEGARAEVQAALASPPAVVLPDWLDHRLAQAEEQMLVVPRQPTGLAREWSEESSADATDGELPLDTRVTSLLMRATRLSDAGDVAGATSAVQGALRLAAPERLRRPFFEASPAVRKLMRVHTDNSVRPSWLDSARASGARSGSGGHRERPSSAGTRRIPGVIVEPLTNREREVLGYLADLLTTDEIAATMFISVNTVRTHVRSILRKLGASRRNEAVRKAWDLQILQPIEPPSEQLTQRVETGPVETGGTRSRDESRA